MLELYGVLLLALISPVESYPNGAPDTACKTMLPDHGVSSQSELSPYQLWISAKDYRANDEIEVMLSGEATFRGFLIKATLARTSDNDESEPTPVGELSSFDYTNSLCEGSALTQIRATEKRTISFIWKAPPTDMGPIVFRYSVVMNKTTFWSNLISKKLEFNNSTIENETSGWSEDYVTSEWSEDYYEEYDELFAGEDKLSEVNDVFEGSEITDQPQDETNSKPIPGIATATVSETTEPGKNSGDNELVMSTASTNGNTEMFPKQVTANIAKPSFDMSNNTKTDGGLHIPIRNEFDTGTAKIFDTTSDTKPMETATSKGTQLGRSSGEKNSVANHLISSRWLFGVSVFACIFKIVI